MKIALASDLHLEMGDIVLHNSNNADVLILSGDIVIAEFLHMHPEPEEPYTLDQVKNLSTKQYKAYIFRKFFERCSKDFKHVVYIAGNHEFYHGKFYDSLVHLRQECSKYSNVYFLEDDTVTIGDYTFIGSTLWTNMNKHDPITMHDIKNVMNDYRVIRNDKHAYRKLSPVDVVSRHSASLQYICDTITKDPNRKYVVVGHHMPSVRSVHEQYKHDFHVNGGYYSELSDVILSFPQIVLWTCGHTHHRHWYYMGDTLVACNPRGYNGFEVSAANFQLRFIDLDNMPSQSAVEQNFSWEVEKSVDILG